MTGEIVPFCYLGFSMCSVAVVAGSCVSQEMCMPNGYMVWLESFGGCCTIRGLCSDLSRVYDLHVGGMPVKGTASAKTSRSLWGPNERIQQEHQGN